MKDHHHFQLYVGGILFWIATILMSVLALHYGLKCLDMAFKDLLLDTSREFAVWIENSTAFH